MTTRAILVAAALLAAVSIPAHAQQAQTGALRVDVKNKLSGEALAGAQVSIQGTQFGGVTNDQGIYLNPRVPAGTYIVQVTFIGFGDARVRDVAVRNGETASLEVLLEQAVLSLQEVVVSATTDPTAGIKVPFTVSKVSSEQLQIPTVNSTLAAIQGKVAGVNIVRASGQPGAGVNIMLRSPTAFEESNSPLIVVDGVVIARDLDRTTADIESLDIESVEVIKGAAAASLYGSRAAAGVVSITTNRGRSQARNLTRVTARTEYGKDYLAGVEKLTTAHHYTMNAAGTSLINSAGRDTTWNGRNARTVTLHGGNARMMDQAYPGAIYDNLHALYRPDQYLNQSFSLSQNTENTTFLVNLVRSDQKGALEGNDGFWRNSGRISLDHRIGQKLSFSLTANHTRTWRDIASGNPYTSVLTYPAYVDLTKKDSAGNYLMLPDPTVEIENPVWRQFSRDHYDKRIRTQASLNARYSPLSWLMFDAQLSYDRADSKYQEYVPKGVPTSVTSDATSSGQLILEHQENDAYNGSLGTTLNRQIGDLNARLALRGTFEKEWRETFMSEGRDFIVQGIRDLSAARTIYNVTSGTTDVRANGMYADLALDFKDRYTGSFLIRRDGSSLFGPLERWHTYKRAAGAWIISRESWFQLPGVNELKLRYAMGEAGGRPGYSSQYESWSISRTTGLARENAGNPTLKPQFTREHDIGIDILAFNNRAQLELVYARQSSKDQIIIVPATVITGYSSVLANAALVKGRTYEATLTLVPVNNRTTRWSFNLVADNSETTLVEWERSCYWGSNAGREHERTCAGERAGDFWMQRTLRSKDELPSWLANRADEFDVNDQGYLVWVGKDANGTPNTWRDGIAIANQAAKCAGSHSLAAVSNGCGWGSQFSANGFIYRWGEPFRGWDEENNEVRRVLMGSSLPDLAFGFNTNLRYKAVTAYVGFRGALGGKVYNDSRQWQYNNLRHGDLDQSGRPDELKKPLDYYQRALSNGDSGFIDEFLEDGTFLKLGEARLAYRLQRAQTRRFLGAMAPSEITFGVNGRNLWTAKKFRGFDPEQGSPLSRIVSVGYPHLRTLTATVDITF